MGLGENQVLKPGFDTLAICTAFFKLKFILYIDTL